MVTEHIEIGVLGLGDKHDHQVNGSYDTFMETLVNQGQIQSYSMSLNLRSADQTGQTKLTPKLHTHLLTHVSRVDYPWRHRHQEVQVRPGQAEDNRAYGTIEKLVRTLQPQ
jgi:hypothetical protein